MNIKHNVLICVMLTGLAYVYTKRKNKTVGPCSPELESILNSKNKDYTSGGDEHV